MKETYVFPSNKDGEYLSWEKMVALAERYAEYDDYEKEEKIIKNISKQVTIDKEQVL